MIKIITFRKKRKGSKAKSHHEYFSRLWWKYPRVGFHDLSFTHGKQCESMFDVLENCWGKKSVRYCQTFWCWGFGIMHHHINSIAQSWKNTFSFFFSSEESHYRLRRKKDVWKISEEMKKMMMLWMTVQFFLSKSDKKLFSRKMKIWCKMGLQKCHLFCFENQSKHLQTVYFFFLTFLFKLL